VNSTTIYFNDDGELTNSKLQDFRNQLRPVGNYSKTTESATPIIEKIGVQEKEQSQGRLKTKPLRGKPQPKKRPLPTSPARVSPNINRPLPPPPIVQTTVIDTKQKPEDEILEIKKEVTETPQEKICDTRKVEEIKLEKPGFFKRTAQGISNFAKMVFFGIKDFFESVFGKLFGRVTKIKVGGKEITFDGHDSKKKLKDGKTTSLYIELDPQAASTLKGVVSLGKIAADHLPPPPPPLPTDGNIPVKNWRQQVQTYSVQEQQTEQVNIKELVEKRRRENQTQGVFGDLAAGLANWREKRHLDEYSCDDEDDEPFFQVTFTKDDGKQTDLTFDGEKTVEISTEVQELQPKEYSGLRKKRDAAGEVQPLDKNVLAVAMSRLNKVEPRVKSAHQGELNDLGNVLLAGFMKNAAHLLVEEEEI
jgi:hypothetical protein